jgi:group I intron endonuclease
MIISQAYASPNSNERTHNVVRSLWRSDAEYGTIKTNNRTRATCNSRVHGQPIEEVIMESLPQFPGVYQIRCTVTNKVYIGSSRNIRQRIAAHQKLLKSGKHDNTYLLRAWKKYGSECFVFSVVELCDLDVLIEREQFYINWTKSSDQKHGYNLHRIAASKGIRQPKIMQGWLFHHSTGTHSTRTPEATAKIAAFWNGRKHRTESIEKMRQSKLGKPEHPNAAKAKVEAKAKEYVVTDPEGNEYLIKNMSEHCRKHGLTNTSMVRLARNRRGVTQHKGWKCRYP